MPSHGLIVQFQTAGGEAKQTVVDRVVKVGEKVKTGEPGAIRYAVVEPRGESDEFWLLEEFRDQAAHDAHMASEHIRDLHTFFAENHSLLRGMPNTTAGASWAFTRPEITSHSEPFMVWAKIHYKEGKRAEALEGWKTVASATEKDEPETLSYSILEDAADALAINTVEVYASEDYFRSVHLSSEAVKANKDRYGQEMRTGMSYKQLRLVGGFLHR